MFKHKKIKWTHSNLEIENITMDNGNVTFYKKIGEGGFSNVLLAKLSDHENTNLEVAVKIEKTNKKNILEHEYKIYQKLKNISGIPIIYGFIVGNNHRYMIMEKMDKSLTDIINKKHRFKLIDVIKLTIWSLVIIKNIHNAGYIHRDIKPSNFMIKNRKLKLIDFGLSKKHIKIFKRYKHNHIIGTLRYCSLNSHLYNELSYRDDLESLGYTILYFLKGNLPWQKIKTIDSLNIKDKVSYLNTKIKNIKLSITLDELCNDVPEIIKNYFKMIRKLKFGDLPNYNKLITNFKEYLYELKQYEKSGKSNYNRLSYHIKYTND